MSIEQPDHERRARDIVRQLYVPDDHRRWGESPINVHELEAMIAHAIAEAVAQEREACIVIALGSANEEKIVSSEELAADNIRRNIATAIRQRGSVEG